MPLKYRKNYSGAGLIEVMVSLLILATGLLGVLTLQANGLNSNSRAEFSTEAQLLAQDMIDRILAYGSVETNGNRGAFNGEYGGTDTNTVIADPACEAPASGGCDGPATVQFDQNQWRNFVINSSLPSARGRVLWNDPEYTVRIMWDQDRTGAAGVGCSGNTDVDLTCYDMVIRP